MLKFFKNDWVLKFSVNLLFVFTLTFSVIVNYLENGNVVLKKYTF